MQQRLSDGNFSFLASGINNLIPFARRASAAELTKNVRRENKSGGKNHEYKAGQKTR